MPLPERPLGDVLQLAPAEVPVEADGTYPIAGVYSFGRGLFQRGPISGSETSYARLNRLAPGRLVMSRLKAFEGALTVIPAEFDGWFLSLSSLPSRSTPRRLISNTSPTSAYGQVSGHVSAGNPKASAHEGNE